MSEIKAALHAVIDTMSDDDAEDLLDYLNLLADSDALIDEKIAGVEEGVRETAHGEYVTLDQLKRDLAGVLDVSTAYQQAYERPISMNGGDSAH